MRADAFLARGTAAAVAIAIVSCTWPAVAADAPGLAVEWPKLATVLARSSALIPPFVPSTTTEIEDRPVSQAPRVSLVARDWDSSRPIVGDAALLDDLRPGRSSRMVISRVRITEAGIAPFAQVGMGQWRVDTTLFPSFPQELDLAALAGLGFEVRLTPHVVGAFETDCTVLQAGQTPGPIAQLHPVLWAGYIAVRTRF
jgi:hypothetical protein